MDFDLGRHLQSADFFNTQLQNMYECVDGWKNTEENTYPRYLCGLGICVALGSFVLNLASLVSAIFEPIIKGIVNIFGALFFDSCSAVLGTKQITIGLCQGFYCMISPVVSLVFAPPVLISGMMIIPEKIVRHSIRMCEEDHYSIKDLEHSFYEFSWNRIVRNQSAY